jgi:hypothetical protein
MAIFSTADLILQADQLQPDNNEQLINAFATRSVDQNIAESSFNKVTDKLLIGLRSYQPARSYEPGESVTYDNGGGLLLWSANKLTTGVFNTNDWDVVGSAGGGDSLTLDQANQNGLILSGSNPQVLGIQLATSSINGALSSTDWQTFNSKQNALGFTPENVAQRGVAGGYTPLNSSGVVDLTYLPDSVTGALNYQGSWNASTNTPNISDATGSKGEYYVVGIQGSQDLGGGTIDFSVGDWVIHNGTVFEKLDNTQSGVESVQGITATNISLGSGTNNAMVVWDSNGVTFRDSGIYESNGRLGVGVVPTIGSLLIQYGNTSTGFGVSSASLYDQYNWQLDGTVFVENRKYNSGQRLTFIDGGLKVGQFNNFGSHLRLEKSKTTGSQINFDTTGVVPTSPNDGDMWSTSSGLFYRKGGATFDLLASGGGGGIPIIGTSTNKAIATWDGTGGNNLQNTTVLIDSGNIVMSANKRISSGDSFIDFGVDAFASIGNSSSTKGQLKLNPLAAAHTPANISNDSFVNDNTSLYFKKGGVIYDLLSGGGTTYTFQFGLNENNGTVELGGQASGKPLAIYSDSSAANQSLAQDFGIGLLGDGTEDFMNSTHAFRTFTVVTDPIGNANLSQDFGDDVSYNTVISRSTDFGLASGFNSSPAFARLTSFDQVTTSKLTGRADIQTRVDNTFNGFDVAWAQMIVSRRDGGVGKFTLFPTTQSLEVRAKLDGAKLELTDVDQNDSNNKILSLNELTNVVEWVDKSTIGGGTGGNTAIIRYDYVKSGTTNTAVTLEPHSSFGNAAPNILPPGITSAKIVGFSFFSTLSSCSQATTATFQVRTQPRSNRSQRPFLGGTLRYTNTQLQSSGAQGQAFYESFNDPNVYNNPATIGVNDMIFIDLQPVFWNLVDINVHLYIEVTF